MGVLPDLRQHDECEENVSIGYDSISSLPAGLRIRSIESKETFQTEGLHFFDATLIAYNFVRITLFSKSLKNFF